MAAQRCDLAVPDGTSKLVLVQGMKHHDCMRVVKREPQSAWRGACAFDFSYRTSLLSDISGWQMRIKVESQTDDDDDDDVAAGGVAR